VVSPSSCMRLSNIPLHCQFVCTASRGTCQQYPQDRALHVTTSFSAAAGNLLLSTNQFRKAIQWSNVNVESRYSHGLTTEEWGVRFQAGVKDSPLLYSVWTSSWAHPASYPEGTAGSFPGGKATVHLHLVPRKESWKVGAHTCIYQNVKTMLCDTAYFSGPDVQFIAYTTLLHRAHCTESKLFSLHFFKYTYVYIK
jgi:hypothetical protein